MRNRNLSSLGGLLGGFASRHGIGERVVAAQIVSAANELLTALIVPGQRGEVQAVSFKNSELVVACKTPAARYLIEGLDKKLGRKLEEKFPSQTFKTVVCRLKPGNDNDEEWYNGLTV